MLARHARRPGSGSGAARSVHIHGIRPGRPADASGTARSAHIHGIRPGLPDEASGTARSTHIHGIRPGRPKMAAEPACELAGRTRLGRPGSARRGHACEEPPDDRPEQLAGAATRVSAPVVGPEAYAGTATAIVASPAKASAGTAAPRNDPFMLRMHRSRCRSRCWPLAGWPTVVVTFRNCLGVFIGTVSSWLANRTGPPRRTSYTTFRPWSGLLA
jgi:hypothetical protein